MSAPPMMVVTRTAAKRYLAEVVGTPLWSAGPSPEYAVGALVLQLGWRFGVAVMVDRTHAAGFCAVPVVSVTRDGPRSPPPGEDPNGRGEPR